MTIRYKKPDKKNAISIIESAKKEMNFTLTIDPSDESASTIIRNIYECYRKLGDALLVSKGIESKDHVQPIKELIKIKVETSRPISLIDNLRKLRHNINYYGYSPSLIEVNDTISLVKSTYKPLFDFVLKEINL